MENEKISNKELEESKKTLKIEFTKWEKLKDCKTEIELKNLAKELYDGLIFTDRHIKNSSDVTLVFIILMLIGNDKNIGNTRQDKIYNILLEFEKEEYFKNRGISEEGAKKEYYESIGLIYEYFSESSPRSINGYPSFFSCMFLSHGDTSKMFEYYNQYKELQEKIKTEFGI